ncbi:MAG TPA: carbohydrate-binding protein [Candidatus Paceibacterota bacterium]|nr:carbohydrate-binding protein [Candidatus Paceibacterota bacterium]
MKFSSTRFDWPKSVACFALCAAACFQAHAQLGAPISIPGRIEAENYDTNGPGVSFNDLSVGNSGDVYRGDAVDIEATSDFGGGYDVGWIEAGEWLNYTINVQETAVYQFTFRVAGWNSSGAIQVSLDGLPLSGTQTPVTGGYQSWASVSIGNIALRSGTHSLRLEFQSGNFNLNYVHVSKQRNLTGNYLRASGKQIVDGAGENVLLRGIGLGNWMLQEPYMLDLNGIVATQTELRQKIAALVGTNGMNAFYVAWLTNYMTEADVQVIARAGFNSIRLPMHYKLFTPPVGEEPIPGQNTWLPTGFNLVSNLVNWCAANHVFLILDMHGAPGGQGYDRPIADYNPPEPSLWESAANRAKLVALWRELATCYATNEWIGGYDLVNEPNWTFENRSDIHGGSDQTNAPLRQLLMDVTAAIREVDTNHLIIVEGNGWGNNYNGIFPPWDANMAVSFHKYWNDPTLASYQDRVALRDQWNVPLWLGESGENSNEWFRDAVRFAEQLNIGWAWWPWKKNDNTDGTVIFSKPASYQAILDYWRNGGAKPSTNTALNAFMELATATRIENCSVRRDVIDALLRAGQETTLPFTNHTAPGIVFASDYDLGRQGVAYFDTTATNGSYNSGYAYRNDSVDIQPVTDSLPGNGYNVGWCDPGDWMKYTVTTLVPGPYRVLARVASGSSGGSFYLETNGTIATGPITVSGTGGWQNWTTINAGTINLQPTNSVRFVVLNAGFNVQWFEFQPASEAPRLSIGSAANRQLVLLWPDWAASFQLYAATNLLPPVVWEPVTNPPVAEAGFVNLSLPMDERARFFRLVYR